MAPQELQTQRLRLSRVSPADAAALHRTVGDAAAMQYWHPGPDQTIDATAARIAAIDSHWQAHGFGDWGVWSLADGQLIGFAGLHYIPGMPEVNIGYALHPSMWRQGLGQEICTQLLHVAFRILQLPELVAVIDPRNTASTRLAEKCGLRLWRTMSWCGNTRVVYKMTAQGYLSAAMQ